MFSSNPLGTFFQSTHSPISLGTWKEGKSYERTHFTKVGFDHHWNTSKNWVALWMAHVRVRTAYIWFLSPLMVRKFAMKIVSSGLSIYWYDKYQWCKNVTIWIKKKFLIVRHPTTKYKKVFKCKESLQFYFIFSCKKCWRFIYLFYHFIAFVEKSLWLYWYRYTHGKTLTIIYLWLR